MFVDYVSVEAGNQKLPNQLHDYHTKLKSVTENQTVLVAQVIAISDKMNDLSSQVRINASQFLPRSVCFLSYIPSIIENLRASLSLFHSNFCLLVNRWRYVKWWLTLNTVLVVKTDVIVVTFSYVLPSSVRRFTWHIPSEKAWKSRDSVILKRTIASGVIHPVILVVFWFSATYRNRYFTEIFCLYLGYSVFECICRCFERKWTAF